MKTTKLLLATLLTFNFINFTNFITNCSAQSPDWLWAKKAGGSTSAFIGNVNDMGNDIYVDNDGNLLLTGLFTGQGVFDTITINGIADKNGFIAKYDSTGKVIWARGIIGSNIHGASITSNSLNEIYLLGQFSDTADFGDTIIYSSSLSWSQEIFFAKYSANGDFLWVQKSQPPTNNDNHMAIEIAVDDSDYVYTVGMIQGSAIFDTITITPPGDQSIFLAKYNVDGNIMWVEQMTENYTNNSVTDMEIDDQGNIYLTGQYTYKIIVNGTYYAGTPSSAPYLLKFNPSGIHEWVRTGLSYPSTSGAFCLAVGNDGSVYIAGRFYDIINFDSLSITPDGNYDDVFITKYNSAGTAQWVKSIACTYDIRAWDMVADNWGGFYITGYFSDTMRFDSINSIVISSFTRHAFIASYTSNGSVNWTDYSGNTPTNYSTESNSITTDACGNPIITGRFVQSIAFGPLPLTSSGTDDIF